MAFTTLHKTMEIYLHIYTKPLLKKQQQQPQQYTKWKKNTQKLNSTIKSKFMEL